MVWPHNGLPRHCAPCNDKPILNSFCAVKHQENSELNPNSWFLIKTMKKQNRIAFFNILSTILLRGISIFTSPLFSRLLGTGGYGILSAYNTWASVFAISGTLQTQGTLVNARVEYPAEQQKQYQSAAMGLSLSFFLTVSAVIVLFMKPIAGFLKLPAFLVVLMLAQAFGTFCMGFLNNKFTYEFKAGRNMLLSVGVSLATLTLSLILVLNMAPENRYLGRIFGNAFVFGLLGAAVCIWVLRSGRVFFRREYWKFCLFLAIPMVFQNLSDLLLNHSDLVMLRQMAGDSAGGIYGLAYNFGNIIFTIFAALNNSWVPFFFEDLKNGEREAVQQKSKNFLELYTVLSVGFVLLMTEIFHLYAGRDFWAGTSLIPLFVAGYYVNFLCTFPVNYEYFHKKTAVVAAVTVSTALLNLVLNYILILKIGMAGAAIATLISHLLQFTLHFTYARFVLKEGEYPFGTFRWVPYAVCFGAVCVLVYLTPKLWYVRWALGAAVGGWELLQLKKRKGIF